MCLNIKWYSIPRIALTDITCYKYVDRDDQLLDVFRTPHQAALVRLGETYTSEIRRNKNEVKEALHSFAKLKITIAYLNKYRPTSYKRGDVIIVRCIIPRGSWYYKGKWGNYKSSPKRYASNRLKYVEIVK
jgi:hypothetical protein